MPKNHLAAIRVIAVGLLWLSFPSAGCKEKPPTVPTGTYVVTITAAGVSPTGIEVPVGSRVQFVNNDTRSHYMHSDPHPDATDCPELNQIGVLNPGQRRETGNLVVVRVCGYHDHDDPAVTTFHGRITVK